MGTIRLLHLSDLHIVDKYKIYNQIHGLSVCEPYAMKALSQFVYVNKEAIDAILISGDIVHAGTNNYLNRAVEFLVSPTGFSPKEPWLNVNRRPTLQTFQKRVVVVPGNHDRFDGRLSLPNGRQFDVYFLHFWSAGAGGVQDFHLPNEIEPLLTIICADFTLESFLHCIPAGHWGQGKVYQERLQRVVQLTEEVFASKPKRAVIWMFHFAPQFEDHCNSRISDGLIKLLDSELLIEEAERIGIGYILCGHTHRYCIYRIGTQEKVKVYCAGTSTCIVSNEDTVIHLLEIEIEEGIVENFRYLPCRWNPNKLIFETTI